MPEEEKAPKLRKKDGTGDVTQVANKILFVQNLPMDVNQDILKGLFSRFSGFTEVRL